MKITIKLLSDLCTASGETYNSIVDTDVVYDLYGLPYIPAKRIKGCIREAALEMRDFGLISREEFTALFGKEGHMSAGFTLSNAYLVDYTGITRALKDCRDVAFVSQQRVLEHYTSMRTQTAVDMNTGVADENSLRTLRVVNKGTAFEADCMVSSKNASLGELQRQKDILRQAISLVKHMGLARTRGLGLIEMQLHEENVAKNSHVQVDRSELKEHNKLRYIITLQSAMICKSAQGNQASTQDYIAGSKVLGIFAGALGREAYRKLTESNEVIVTNAYIMHEGRERCSVGAASLQKEKDQPWQSDGTMKISDMRYDKAQTAEKQMTPAGIDYMGADGTKVDVTTEISYHHQRPNDKSIGRATGNAADGSAFYQLCSISEGQSFCGYIYADRKQAEQILDAAENLGKVRMGYGKSSEFGAVDFVIDQNETIETVEEKANEAAVTLVSDMILYNESGCLSTELSVLKQYLCEALKVSDIVIKRPFLVFTTIGGYNVTWGTRKPTFRAFGKGTAFLIHSDTEFDINSLNRKFIGERVAEGFGEIVATKLKESDLTVKKPSQDSKNELQDHKNSEIMQALMQLEFEKMLQKEVMDRLNHKKAEYRKQVDGFNAAVSKIRLVYKSVAVSDTASYKSMTDEINGIESAGKQKLCRDLMKLVKLDGTDGEDGDLGKKILAEFNEKYEIDYKPKMSDQELFRYVYRIYITELKHFAKTLDKEVTGNGR